MACAPIECIVAEISGQRHSTGLDVLLDADILSDIGNASVKKDQYAPVIFALSDSARRSGVERW